MRAAGSPGSKRWGFETGIPSPSSRPARDKAARPREQRRSSQTTSVLPYHRQSDEFDEDQLGSPQQHAGHPLAASEPFFDPGEFSTGEHFTVLVRTRPLNDTEFARHGDQECLRLDDGGQSITLLPNMNLHHRMSTGPYSFKYDHVLEPTSPQSRVFDLVGRVGCEHFLDGYNVAMFAYGQTGAGKTHTMYGDLRPPELHPSEKDISDQAGLVPRCLGHIFESVETIRARGTAVDLRVSFIEIYNEAVIDLLSQDARFLTVRENVLRDRTFVDGATEARVETVQQCLQLLRRGAMSRTTGATAMNKESSRSHSVFTVAMDLEEKGDDGKRMGRESRFHLVDLAGSERQKYSKAEGRHLREATNINRSLTAFGKVIMALAAGSKHVPYRDSKLTFLLKNSIGGNSKTFLIANIGLSPRTQDETLSTLKFASFAKKPMLHVSRNVTNRDATVEDLKMEISKLKQQLARGRWHTDSLMTHASPLVLETKMRGDGSGEGEAMLDAVYTSKLELLLRQALERENDLRMKLMREKEQFRAKLDEYERLCRSLEQCLQSSKMIIKFKDLKLKDMHPANPDHASNPQSQSQSQSQSQTPWHAEAVPGQTAEVNPQLVRAKITIRSLQDELNALRGTDAPDRAAEKLALDQHVIQLTDQVKRLLDKVHELESASSAAQTVGQGAQRIEEALLDKEEIIASLDNRLQSTAISLEEERRAHISALELVQELREAEEEWARALDETRREAQGRLEKREHEYQTQVRQLGMQLQRKEEALSTLLHQQALPKQLPARADASSPRHPGASAVQRTPSIEEQSLREEIHGIERQYEEELEGMREEMHREREAREAVARELQEVQAEKADWDSTIQCLQAALDKSLEEYDHMQRLVEEAEGRVQEVDKALEDEKSQHLLCREELEGAQGKLLGETDARVRRLEEELAAREGELRAKAEEYEELAARHVAVQAWMNRRHEQEVEWLMTIDQKDRDARLLREEVANLQRMVDSQREEIEELREAEEEWVRAVREAQGFHETAAELQRAMQPEVGR